MPFAAAPVLETERLVLRPYRLSDFDAFADYFGSERSIFTDGPVTRETAWDLFTAGAGRWAIVGHGAWTIEIKASGQAAGLVSLNTAISLPDSELGWILWAGFEGKGYAYEACQNALRFAFDILLWPSLVSGIHEENAASIRLAERLGAARDPDLVLEHEPETLFYRHLP